MEAMKDKVIQNHDETMGGVEEIRKLLEKMRKRGEDEVLCMLEDRCTIRRC